ncbi:MAG: sulfite exporter TauE/SafE family protein [Brachymonas sp.]|nr:sulfite exporter TauE/SafE family protein [Brachymonas sp.]
MPSILEFQWLLFGACAGLLIYLSGVGAGVIVVPVMVVLFQVPVAAAVGTASLFSVACKIAAGLSHIQQRNVSRRLLRAFLPAAVVSCLWLAALISLALPNVWPQGQSSVDFGLKMLVLTVGSLAVGSIYVPQIKRWIAQLRIRTTALITGALVGATGTGGGVLVVPALMAEGSESTQRIIGSSLIIGLILSAVTALFYGAAGSLNLSMALWMTAGSLLAMPVARMIFKRVSAQALTHLVASLAAASLVLLAFNLLQAR